MREGGGRTRADDNEEDDEVEEAGELGGLSE